MSGWGANILIRRSVCCTRDSLFTWRNQKLHFRFSFVLFCFSFWFRPQHQRRPHVHTFYVHHNRQRSGINILVQVFMSSSTLTCSSETRNSCDEAISFESHKKSSRRLTSEWHKNSFWLTLTCTKFSLFVCLALSAVDSTLARVQRELLIVVLGIRSSFSDFLHPQPNISFCSSCRREWQVYVTRQATVCVDLRVQWKCAPRRCPGIWYRNDDASISPS